MDKELWVVLIQALILGVCLFLLGGINKEHRLRQEAIKAGVAEYYIDTNDFSKQFRWLTNR